MRVACLLMGLIPLFVYCQPDMRNLSAEVDPYDTLQKYSYLIIGTIKDAKGRRIDSVDTSSGFFFRKNKRLYLISAFHVLTNCDVYATLFRQFRTDSIQVWYRTADGGKYNFERLPPKWIRGQPLNPAEILRCFSITDTADVAFMDVTGRFKDGNIYSIERMVPENLKDDALSPGDSIVGYGYHGLQNLPVWGSTEIQLPAGAKCEVIDMPDQVPGIPDPDAVKLKQALVPRYEAILPGYEKGVSGAPLFKIWSARTHKRIVEFAGVQSGHANNQNFSLMVKLVEVMKLISN